MSRILSIRRVFFLILFVLMFSGLSFAGGESKFEKNFSLPECDSSDESVRILSPAKIKDHEELENELNRDDKRIFCLKPGDYRPYSGNWGLFIKNGGKPDKRHYLRYYNPDMPEDTHPWNMENPDQITGQNRVLLPIVRLRASYWTLDRLRLDRSVKIQEANHTVLNRLMFYEMRKGDDGKDVQTVNTRNSHHVWIQNSVFGEFPQWDVGSDDSPFDVGTQDDGNLALNLVDSDYVYFVDNEVWDPFNGDIVQTAAYGNREHINRTVVADNDMWLEDDMWKEPYENAIDFKLGPSKEWPKEEWSLVENNRIWNFQNKNNTYLSWNVITTHLSSNDAYIIRDNLIWDSNGEAISITNEGSENIVEGNIIYDMRESVWGDRAGISVGPVEDSLIKNNIFVDAGPAWNWADTKPRDTKIKQNVFINSDVGKKTYENRGNEIAENAYYNSSTFAGANSNSITYDRKVDANHEELSLRVREITGPVEKEIKEVKVSSESPHSSWFENSAVKESKIEANLNLRNSNGSNLEKSVEIYDEKGKKVKKLVSTTKSPFRKNENYRIVAKISDNELSFKNVNFSREKDFEGYLQEIDDFKISPEKKTLAGIAVDLNNSFGEADVKLNYTADSGISGKNISLNRCEEWDISQELCKSNWQLVENFSHNKAQKKFKFSVENFSAYIFADEKTVSDSRPPNITVNHSPIKPNKSQETTISASASDSGTGIEEIRVYVDSIQKKTCQSTNCSVVTGPFEEASTHNYAIEAEDASGNIEIKTASIETEANEGLTNQTTGNNGEDNNDVDNSGGGTQEISQGEKETGIDNLSFGVEELELSGELGEELESTIELHNGGKTSYTYQIDVERIDSILNTQDEIYLKKEESDKIPILANLSGIKSGGYQGSLEVENEGNSKSIPVWVLVNSRDTEFDLDVNFEEKADVKSSLPGYTVTAFNLGDAKPTDGNFSVKLMDSNKDKILEEDFAIENISGAKSVKKAFDANLPKGSYTIRATTSVKNDSYAASEFFEVKKSNSSLETAKNGSKDVIIDVLMVLILIALVEVIFYYYEWRKFYDKAKERGRTISKLADESAVNLSSHKSVKTSSSKIKNSKEQNKQLSRNNGAKEESEEKLKQKTQKLEQKFWELNEESQNLKQMYQEGEISRREYKRYLQNKQQEEQRIKKKLSNLRDKI